MPCMRMWVWSTTSSPSVLNVISRCLPFDSTAFTVPPTMRRCDAAWVIFGATTSKPVTMRPSSARRSTVAVRKIVSPSGMDDALQIAARRAREAGLAQRRGERGLVDGRAVDGLDEERAHPFGGDLRGKRAGDARMGRVRVAHFRDECQLLLLAAPEPSGKPTVDEDHERPRGAHRPTALRPLG